MRGENLNDAEWLAVSNLLRRQRSAAFFRQTLQEIRVTHTFIVSDTGTMPGQGIGSSFGQGARSVAFPKGFPPTGVYQLSTAMHRTAVCFTSIHLDNGQGWRPSSGENRRRRAASAALCEAAVPGLGPRSTSGG